MEFRYVGTSVVTAGQNRVTFETTCEHEYGYEQQELKVLYKGVYYLKNEMFFRQDSCHIYSPCRRCHHLEGEKRGVLKWQIKVITKE